MFRRWIFALVILFTLVGGALAQPVLLVNGDIPVSSPTPLPSVGAEENPSEPVVVPRQEFTFPQGFSVASLPVGGLTLDQAGAALERHRLAPLRQPLLLHLGERSILLNPADVGLRVDVDRAMARMEELARLWPFRRWSIFLAPDAVMLDRILPEELTFSVSFSETRLRSFLEDLAQDFDRPAVPFRSAVLTDTTPVTTSGVVFSTWSPEEPTVGFFRSSPGRRLDVEASLPLVETALLQWHHETVSLQVEDVLAPPRSLVLLQEVLRQQIGRMPGVTGVYVHNLQGDQGIGVNDQVVFSGASVVKIAIMLQAFRVLASPPEGRVAQDLEAMMVYSDNGAANRLLALGGDGNGVRGATNMTEMLQQLDLSNTFMRGPYGSGQLLGASLPHDRSPGRAAPEKQEEVVTSPDPFLQTTPRDMGLLLAYLYEGSLGQGPLLENFAGEITAEECQSMLDLMGQNADRERIVAGLPEGVPVAHKSGWIPDMKADAGIVFSPGGPYVLSIFTWEEDELSDQRGNPRIASLSWITYSFFNPF